MRIAVSMGDPSGIGPEIIVKALSEAADDLHCLVYGVRVAFERGACNP